MGGGANRFQERAYRARLDLISPTLSGNWSAARDTAWDQELDAKFRLRIGVRRVSGTGTINTAFRLMYQINGGGPLFELNPSSEFVRMATSSHYTNHDDFNGPAENFMLNPLVATPIGTPNGAYVQAPGTDTGSYIWSSAIAGAEYEFCMELVEGDVSLGDVITFKMQRANGDEFTSAALHVPTLTVVGRGAIDGAGNIGQVVSGSGRVGHVVSGAGGANAVVRGSGLAAATVQGAGYFGPSVKGSGVIRPEGS